MRGPATRWYLNPRPQPQAGVRLICLPHAGGGASTYFAWGAALEPAGIEVRAVQYPGRETRFGETCITDAYTMIRALADAWNEITSGESCAIFGHSMGALLGFELSVELTQRAVRNPPRHVFLSGHNPPDVPSRLPTLHTLPDAQFLRSVATHYGNLPAELITNPEMAALITPILRADFTLVDEYAWRGTGPATSPLTVLGGANDPWTSELELAQWHRHTRGPFRLQMFPGDHFFHQQHRAAVAEVLTASL